GEPLFPFGFGLSYTTFSYKKLKVNATVHQGDSVKVAVNVKNTGKVAGDEVVELYLSDLTADVPVPIHALKGFTRIHLNPGETKSVVLTLSPEAFSIIDNDNQRKVKPGKFEVFIGGHQPDPKTAKEETGILKKVITLI
ncbi:MAG: fibronectin type III-like domain-contianing protein, partial [Bacteroidota bacterium]